MPNLARLFTVDPLTIWVRLHVSGASQFADFFGCEIKTAYAVLIYCTLVGYKMLGCINFEQK